MAITEAPPVNPEVATGRPRTDGPVAGNDLRAGHRSLWSSSLGRDRFSQVNYALSDRVLTQNCIDQEISLRTTVRSASATSSRRSRTPSRSGALYLGIGLGAVALVLGAATYRRMDTKRRRDDAITGAVLGAQAGSCSLCLILWFRSASPGLFAKHFLNFADLEGYGGAFVRGAINTLILAFAGEIGGIVIGLVLGDPHALVSGERCAPRRGSTSTSSEGRR